MKTFFKRIAEKWNPPKEGEILGDYSDILIYDLEKRLGSLECFRFIGNNDDFKRYKTKKERSNFIVLVANYYLDKKSSFAKFLIDYVIDYDS